MKNTLKAAYLNANTCRVKRNKTFNRSAPATQTYLALRRMELTPSQQKSRVPFIQGIKMDLVN